MFSTVLNTYFAVYHTVWRDHFDNLYQIFSDLYNLFIFVFQEVNLETCDSHSDTETCDSHSDTETCNTHSDTENCDSHSDKPFQFFDYLDLSRSDRRQREKINLHFYFHISLWCFKRFYEAL